MITENIYNELKKLQQGPVENPSELDPIIQYLHQQGYIEGINIDTSDLSARPTAWELTMDGKVALEEFEEAREKQAKAERQQRFENKISVASVLVPCITFVLGLLVEHFSGIVARIAGLLG